MAEFEAIGILRRYLGESRLVTDRGTFRLRSVPRVAETWTGFAKVRGALADGSCLDVVSIRLLGEDEPGPYPFHYGRAADPVWAAGKLRGTAHQFLWQRGFTETFLPSAWPRFDGADGSDMRIAHPTIDLQRLQLRRSPDAAAYVTLASGLTNWYSFARCWQAETELNVHPRDSLLESEQLMIARAGWSMAEMMELASDLLARLSESVGLDLPRKRFHSRDLSRQGRNERFSRTVRLPSDWGSEVRQVVLDRLRRLRCEFAEGAGGDPNCIQVSGPAESSLQVEYMVSSIELTASTGISAESLRALKLHPTWVMHPPFTSNPEHARAVQYAINPLFTSQLVGVDPPHLHQATLYMAGLAVGSVSLYADARTLSDNLQMGSRGLPVELSYLAEMLKSAPPGIGAISFDWERLCSRLAGSNDSAGMQPIGRLTNGGLPSKPVGPR